MKSVGQVTRNSAGDREEGGSSLRAQKGPPMLHFVRAVIIMRRILDPNFKDWEYEFVGGLIRARLRRRGWHAELRSACDNSIAYDLEKYLEACRTTSSAYKIDLWVDGEGLVFSARHSARDISVLLLKRGRWETLYFRLPSPKTN